MAQIPEMQSQSSTGLEVDALTCDFSAVVAVSRVTK
jgi:hypothetical protein